MNNKTLPVGLILLALLITALVTRSGDVAWLMLPFLFYLGTGLLLAPPAESLRFEAARTLEQTRADGIQTNEMTISLQNLSALAVGLLIQETAQAGLQITGGSLSRRLELRAAETSELKYTFTAARGVYTWKTLRLIAADPLGLVETELFLPAPAQVQVNPPVKKFKAIHLRPHSTLHAPGSIPARLGGSGTDFFGIREYHPGDPLRWLDWRLTARHPHRFFTREFEQEEIAEIGLILDARSGSDLQIGAESIFETSVGATASLAELFLHQGHKLSLFVFGERMHSVFPGYGKTQLQRVMACLSKIRVGAQNRTQTHLDFIPIRMFPSRALIIIISPITARDRPFFLRLRAYGYQALLISPDTLDFASGTLAQDLPGQLALRAARLERRIRLNDIARMQIPVIDWQVRQPLFPLVRQALTRARGQRE